MKKISRFFTLALVVLTLLGSLQIAVFADNSESAKICIDLTGYEYDLGGILQRGDNDADDYTAQHGIVNNLEYKIGEDEFLWFQLNADESQPIRTWSVNDTQYTFEDEDDSEFLSYGDDNGNYVNISLGMNIVDVEVSGTPSSGVWVIKPVVASAEFVATTETSDPEKGTVGAEIKETNIYEITARAVFRILF